MKEGEQDRGNGNYIDVESQTFVRECLSNGMIMKEVVQVSKDAEFAHVTSSLGLGKPEAYR